MNRINEFELRIRQKMENLQKMFNELNHLSGEELTKKLWEVEREAALLREFIEQNRSEDMYKEVV